MEICYRSTRGDKTKLTASGAILEGLARDGGLYMPSSIPSLPASLGEMKDWSYQKTALEILSLYLTDYPRDVLKNAIHKAYGSGFEDGEVGLRKAGDLWYLELFHGPTMAFKDMALQLLPYLMTEAMKIQGRDEKILILTATSGDTGKAAMEGFRDVEGTGIAVFFPDGAVSEVQEKQMRSQQGRNTFVSSILGNFDDAQTEVKHLFMDKELREELKEKKIRLSSANSINIGRLVPQIVYYVYAYSVLLRRGVIEEGEKIRIVVPTGNFGNILAAYFASLMGLPVQCFLCASNKNRVLTDFFETGIYDKNREFFVTESPSMDILVSSNLERLLSLITGDAERTKSLMASLQGEGAYRLTAEEKQKTEAFLGICTDEEETREEIRRVFGESGYLIDPHTAVASSAAHRFPSDAVSVIASTASPYKFLKTVYGALCEKEAEGCRSEWEMLPLLEEYTKTKAPSPMAGLREAPVLHTSVLKKEDLRSFVLQCAEKL